MKNRSTARRILRTLFVGITWMAIPVIRAQDESDWQTKAGNKMSFEVASIRPDTGKFRAPNFALDAGDAYAATGGLLSADFALPTYISFAYKLSFTADQMQAMVARLPKWVAEDRFDIQAKAADSNPTKDQMRLMMQALLAERFKLAVHFETRDTPVLALVLAKPGQLGPKLHAHAEGPPCDAVPAPDVFPPRCHLMGITSAGVRGRAKGGSRDTTIPLIADALPSMGGLDRPVIDRTGLSGRFDFAIEWSRDPDSTTTILGNSVPDAEGPSFYEALREQLGLKLESTRAPLQILVIDRVERPSEN